MTDERNVHVMYGDLDDWFADLLLSAGECAWDIETSGLDWTSDRIGTCQVATRERIAVVQIVQSFPERLRALLQSVEVVKVFHHAPFDLRFMAHQWKVHPQRIACTKIASKILEPNQEPGEYSLKPVLRRHLGIEIDKQQQRSDWLREVLTTEQLLYAATDVAYLLDLADHLFRLCSRAGLDPLLEQSFEYLPTRVELDLRGSGDVFAY